MLVPATISDVKTPGRYQLDFNAGVLYNTLPDVNTPKSTDLIPGYVLSLDSYVKDPTAQTLSIQITVSSVAANTASAAGPWGQNGYPVHGSNPETSAPGLGIAGQGNFSGQQGYNMPAGGNVQAGTTIGPPEQIGTQFFGADDATVIILGAIAALIGVGLVALTLNKVQKIVDSPAISTAIPIVAVVLLIGVAVFAFVQFRKGFVA
jgi:hypothetical protein